MVYFFGIVSPSLNDPLDTVSGSTVCAFEAAATANVANAKAVAVRAQRVMTGG
jgi:hypothetical protein